jgi:DNA-binding NtrC family response regulator
MMNASSGKADIGGRPDDGMGELIGAAESMQDIFALAHKIAPCDVAVLVTGETGTGKELLARAIHRLSPRTNGPFVAFSCANMPETLVDDELFGHERGAFTGAVASRRGRFEAAHGGTLLLDEIGDLPLGLQAKLLRVLQERSFERLGGNSTVTVNIRLLCATHRSLPEMVKQGTFREDLYYRLNVVQLHLPPLRERRESIAVLAQHFVQRFAEQFGKQTMRFSSLALGALEEHDWPGNVRQLENVVQRAVVLAEGATVEIWHLPVALGEGFKQNRLTHSYDDSVRDFKRRLILRTLQECGGNKAESARTLGLARAYLYRLINVLHIENTASV